MSAPSDRTGASAAPRPGELGDANARGLPGWHFGSCLQRRALAALLVLLVVLAYANALHSPFVFDDFAAIRDNETIRHLSRMGTVLWPRAGGTTVAGRPLVNLSFALNRAVGGDDPAGYHVANLLVHVAATLTLFGLLRRSLGLRGMPIGLVRHATALAFAAAATWALHPLQTESVTYLAQRAESLAGLFCLLTLYAFLRGAVAPSGGNRWLAGSTLACLAGVATKETAVVTPLLVALFDATFVAGCWREAWRLRRWYYAGLGASWLLAAALVSAMGLSRGSSAGLAAGVGVAPYVGQQAHAILLYLRLAVWPTPLVFDYGTAVPASWQEVWPQCVAVAALLIATGWALLRRPPLGFLAASFFLLLAPSSSFVPVASQTMAEHRMYLPLAVVTVGVLLAFANRLGSRAAVIATMAAALAAGVATSVRNRDYASELALWADTAAKVPDNPRALANHGSALLDAGRPAEAAAVLLRAASQQPNAPEIESNLALSLLRAGRAGDAVEPGRRAVALAPASFSARVNLGSALVAAERWREATEQLRAARALQPAAADVRRLLVIAYRHHAMALARAGDPTAALAEIQAAIDLDPDEAELHFVLGNVQVAKHDFASAIAAYRSAVTLDPRHARARNNLANALLVTGDVRGAIAEYRASLELQPDQPATRQNLEAALALPPASTAR
jgi:Flp pilus assembly protein TadD